MVVVLYVYVYSTFFAFTDFISFEEPNLDLCWKANLARLFLDAFWVQPIYVPEPELCKPITSLSSTRWPICIDIINITLLKAIVAIVNFVIHILIIR